MRQHSVIRSGGILFLTGLVVSAALVRAPSAEARELPTRLTDTQFWELITELSEEGGRFPGQYMSNEDSALFVVPDLRARTEPGGVYLGVGSEQNFTYIAAIDPGLAFILDIRPDNMLQHLFYKALFELAPNRMDFVSRLFARPSPEGLADDADVETLFRRLGQMDRDPDFFEQNLGEALEVLRGVHGFPLSATDQATIRQIAGAMMEAGPDTLQGFGDATNPSYAELMAATDLEGHLQSYLASEENFRVVRGLEERNLVVPVVGDFAGTKAIRGIGNYLRDLEAVADVFYVSNVERYLFDQGESGMQFYRNVDVLPRGPQSLFIRSVTSDISYRLGIPIPQTYTKWRTFLFSIEDCLAAFASGEITDYRALFEGGFEDRVNRPPE